jgi:hypothetical protein
MTVTVTVRGPLFDGRAETAMRDMTRALKDDTGRWALDHLKAGTSVFRYEYHPATGRYAAGLDVEPRDADTDVVFEHVVYGAWIEGVGSRNARSRFKGYFLFRRAATALNAALPNVTAKTVAAYISRFS